MKEELENLRKELHSLVDEKILNNKGEWADIVKDKTLENIDELAVLFGNYFNTRLSGTALCFKDFCLANKESLIKALNNANL